MPNFLFKKDNDNISKKGKVILFDEATSALDNESQHKIKEVIDNLKNTYFTLLSDENDEKFPKFIKFILECIINQCGINIKRIKKLNKIYTRDLEDFKITIGGSTIYKVYPVIAKRIVFTTNDIVEECKLHINSVNKVLNKLVEQGYLVKEKRKGTNRVTFTYTNMYDILTNTSN